MTTDSVGTAGDQRVARQHGAGGRRRAGSPAARSAPRNNCAHLEMGRWTVNTEVHAGASTVGLPADRTRRPRYTA